MPVTPYRERVRQTPDLLGYWRMGDTAGTVVRDHFYGDDATVTYPTTAPTFGVTGPLTDETPAPTAMTFDATATQYLACGSSLRYNLSRVVTVEFWIKKASAPAAVMAVVSRRTDSNFGWEAYLETSGYVTLWIGDNTAAVTTITSTVSVCDGSWHHVVLVRDGHAGYVWVDGVSRYSSTTVAKTIGSMAIAQADYAATSLRIGAGYNGSLYGYLTGSLAEVAVYSRALSQAEVTYRFAGTGDGLPTPIIEIDWAQKGDAEVYADVVRAAGPVAYWRFDGTVTNEVSPSDAGAFAGSPLPVATVDYSPIKSTIPRMCATVTSGTGHFAATSDTYTDVAIGTAAFSAEGWFWTEPSSSAASMFEKMETSGAGGWAVFHNTTEGLVFRRTDSGGAFDSQAGPCPSYGWHHIAATYSGSTMQLYVDGVAWGSSQASSRSIPNTTIPFSIYRWFTYAQSTGKFSDIAIYNRALSAAEIARHYDLGVDPGYSDAIDNITSRVMEVRRVSGRSADFSADAQGELTLKCANADRFFTPQRNLIENPSFENDLRWWSTTERASAYLRAPVHRRWLWRLDDATTAPQQSHGSLLHVASWTALSFPIACDAIPGLSSPGISFNGSTSYAQVTDTTPARLSGPEASVSVWVKVTARPSAGNVALIAGFTTTTGWNLTIDENGILKFGTYSGSAYVTSSVALTNGVWYHVLAFQSTNAYYYLFIDGVDRTSGFGLTQFLQTDGLTMSIGGRTGQFFNGVLKDLSVSTSDSYSTNYDPSAATARVYCALVAAGGIVGDGCTIAQTTDAPTGAGSRCMAVTMPARKYAGGHTTIVGHTFPVGSRYSLSMYLKSSSGGTSMTIGVGTDAVAGALATSDVTITGSWARYTLTWTMPVTADSLVVFVRNNAASVAVVLVDAVQVNGGSTSPTYLEGPTKRQLAQGSPVRMRATYNGVTYPLFTGVIERIVPNDKAAEPYVTIYARDALFMLSRAAVQMLKRTRSLREIRRDALNQSLLPGSDNLITNGTFETGLTGWTAGTYGAISHATVGPPGFAAHAMLIACTYTGTNQFQQGSAAYRTINGLWPPGAVLTLSAWVKVTGRGSGYYDNQLSMSALSPTGTLGFLSQRPLDIPAETWRRVTVQGTCTTSASALTVGILTAHGASVLVSRVTLSVGKAVRDASPAAASPVIRANMADGLLGEVVNRHNCDVTVEDKNRASQIGATIYRQHPGQEYGGRVAGWLLTPDGSDGCVLTDRSGPGGIGVQVDTVTHPDEIPYMRLMDVKGKNEGTWTELKGSFNKGVTYRFCADIAGGATGDAWRCAVFSADDHSDISYGTEVNSSSGWTTVTWSWTPTSQCRRARLAFFCSTYASGTGIEGYLTRVRCIEYGSTITYASPPEPTVVVGDIGVVAVSDYTDTRPDGGIVYASDPRLPVGAEAKINMALTAVSGQTYRCTATMWYHDTSTATARAYFGAPGDETGGQEITGDWRDYIFDWTPSANRDDVRLRIVNESGTYIVLGLLIANVRLTQEQRNPPWIAPIVSRSPGKTLASATSTIGTANFLGLPSEEGETFAPDYEVTGDNCLSVLGWVNAQSGSRHYSVPTLTAPYFFEYRVTTIDEARLKGTAEEVDDGTLIGLTDFVVGAESLANTVIVRTGPLFLDEIGATQFQTTDAAGVAGDEYSGQRHGVYPLERTLQIEGYPEYGYVGGPVEYDRFSVLPFRLSAHLLEKYRESRARPTARRVNHFPAMLRRAPDDVYEVTTAVLGLSGARFSIQTQSLVIDTGGKIWSLEESLEEM
jgi:hypothetical protein